MPLSTPTFIDEVSRYGCTDLVSLEHGLSDPAQLDYIDLLPKGKRGRRPTAVAAVAESQGVALLYLVNDYENALTREERRETQELLANRSDPAWLGIVKTGSLEIYPIGFASDGKSHQKIKTVELDSPEAPLLFQILAQGSLDQNKSAESADYIFKKIFQLLNKMTEAFVPQKVLEPLDVLSMAGRALFFRFLIDRKIVRSSELPEICDTAKDLFDVFSNAEKAARTCVWLDETFNGDFLSLINDSIPVEDRAKRLTAYRSFFREKGRKTNKEIFAHLSAILNGWEVVGEFFQTELDWGDLNFAHIPVGVLSQVYESFSHLDDSDEATRNSVHYTPRIIAELMVNQAFSACPDPANAKMLDPSCGAGIFLVLAFRRLIYERWVLDEERPSTKVIHDTLYKQLKGFDVSESALRLASLSLYITAIELNATQRPPKLLKFPRNLRNTVLHYFGPESDQDRDKFLLGSLQDSVAEKFAGEFDIILGNPPWTRLRESEAQYTDLNLAKGEGSTNSQLLNIEFTKIGKEVLNARGLEELAKDYKNPDNNPDLPFIWRATQWAKKNGIITLALPARVIVRHGSKGDPVWRSIAKSISLTGIFNGSNLRKTPVWGGVDVSWCVLFAKNQVPSDDQKFHFVAPFNEPESNTHARFRIDYDSASVVSVSDTIERPWLLKTLTLGTSRDVELMDQILGAFPATLEEVWSSWDPDGEKTGQGFNRSPDLKQDEKKFLGKLPVFERPNSDFSIQEIEFKSYFSKFGSSSALWPRNEELYQAPLVIIPKSPRPSRFEPKAFRSNRALAFSQISYGYSLKGHSQPEVLSSLLYLLPHSTLFTFFCLMRSRSQGTDYMMFVKRDFDSLPFPQVEELSKPIQKRLIRIADQLEFSEQKPWKELDQLIFKIYQLDEEDVQVAEDTLFSAAAYRHEGRAALDPPTPEIRRQFAKEIEKQLQPFFEVCGESVIITQPEFQDVFRSPWFFLKLEARGKNSSEVSSELLTKAMEEANRTGSSRVIIRLPRKSGLLLGILSHQRWWTTTRARICSQYIVRNHLAAFQLDSKGVVD